MGIIIKIEVDSQSKGRYNIYIDMGNDDPLVLNVDEGIIGHYLLRKEMEIDDFLIEEIRFKDAISTGYKKALHFLTSKRRSKKEVEDFLLPIVESKTIVTEIVKRLIDHHLIDDIEYAKSYVRTQKNVGRLGPSEIIKQLDELGLSGEEIEQGMKEYPYAEQVDNASFWQEKILKKLKNSSPIEKKQKLQMAMYKKGFNASFIQVMEEENEDEEMEALRMHGEKFWKKHREKEPYERKMKVKQALYRKGFDLSKIDQFLNDME